MSANTDASTPSTTTTTTAAAAAEWRLVRRGLSASGACTVLGEGALWSVADQCLYWLDIEQSLVHRYTPPSPPAVSASSSNADQQPSDAVGGSHASVRFNSMVGCLALTEKPHQVLLAAASGLWLLDWSTLRAWPLAPFPERDEPEAFRFNDGGVSPDGTLVVGTLYKDEERGADRGSLYEYACTADGSIACRPVHRGVSIPNGLDWSDDGRTLLFIDTPEQRVDAFDWTSEPFVNNGNAAATAADPAPASSTPLSRRRPAFDVPREHAHPDGMTLDADGSLWIAHWAGARVTRFSATGELQRCIALPTSQTTCPCFGGPQLRDLYVTSASRGLDLQKEPLAGSLFVVPNAGQGRAAKVFRGCIAVDDAKAVQLELVDQQ